MNDHRFLKLANPLLYYIDKNGNSVFRNYNILKNDGYLYNEIIQVKQAGNILEYRLELDKKLKWINISSALILYLWFIHLSFNIFILLLFMALWIGLIYCTRIIASKLYSKKIIEKYGMYKIINFNPKLSEDKINRFKKDYLYKILISVVIIAILFIPSILLLKTISFMANRKEPNIKYINAITSIYTLIYPKTPLVYDINAVSKYKNGEFSDASEDYIKIFKMTGKRFEDKDYKRFANLLYLVKKSKGAQDALDKFNEYTTAKKLNFEQKLKLLWIKSNFSISSGVFDFVIEDYDDLLSSVAGNKKKEFYVLADKAYMLYLLKDFKSAIQIYNNLIPYAQENQKTLGNQLVPLYLERGFAKLEFGDTTGADTDFVSSKVDINKIGIYEPVLKQIDFIIGNF